MALKITCPKCSNPNRLNEPYPVSGGVIQCLHCGFSLTITYPTKTLEKLKAKGVQFRTDTNRAQEATNSPPKEPHQTAPPKKSEKPTPTAQRPPPPPPETEAPEPPPQAEEQQDKPKKKRSLIKRLVLYSLYVCVFFALVGAGVGVYAYNYFAEQVPTVETLREYTPPTVTVVYDRNNEVLAEIYENRRYVTAIDNIPKHVQDAFIAAEDANFWNHTGVDYMGIVRAVIRNALKGRKAQGASTITQQVAKNFLLTSEKTYTRKIKEAILAQRIEKTFDKNHILFLYLNQIYLGSSAYGVEAASRVYFDKHVTEITLAEAAILAGLPQRPSDYSPHANWEKARARQMYVLNQLKNKKFISQEEFDSAAKEMVRITKKENQFRKQAPYYTEHVRRYLVDTYGSKKVYNDGLEVVTACDLKLQKEAQRSLKKNVERADRSSGWRGSLSLVGIGADFTLNNKKNQRVLCSK